MAGRAISGEIRAFALEQLRAGVPKAELQRTLGVNRNTIARWEREALGPAPAQAPKPAPASKRPEDHDDDVRGTLPKVPEPAQAEEPMEAFQLTPSGAVPLESPPAEPIPIPEIQAPHEWTPERKEARRRFLEQIGDRPRDLDDEAWDEHGSRPIHSDLRELERRQRQSEMFGGPSSTDAALAYVEQVEREAREKAEDHETALRRFLEQTGGIR